MTLKIDFGTFDKTPVDGWSVKIDGNQTTYTREFAFGGGGDYSTANYSMPAGLTRNNSTIIYSAYQTRMGGAYELSWTMLFATVSTFFFYRKKLGTSNVDESIIVVRITTK